MKILVNHMGYSANGSKKLVVQCQGESPAEYVIVTGNNEVVYTGTLRHEGTVANWKTGDYYVGDFSDFSMDGVYRIRVGNEISEDFEVRDYLITMRMINAATYYFKAQRSSGEWLEDDRDLPFQDGYREGRVDAHGGWYDATGDYGIHITHLSHSTYHNPQQLPFSAYTFFKAHEFLTESGNECYTMIKRRMLDEGFWGVNFLMRMRAPSGGFFRSVNRVEALTAVEGTRYIGLEYKRSSRQFGEAVTAKEEIIGDENYEISLRAGGGLTIAALAIAGRFYYPSAEYSQSEYVRAAKSAWKYLSENNERYTNDGKWNLIDEYCALMATTELYLTTKEYDYLRQARKMAQRIYARTVVVGENMLRLEIEGGLPYFHAAEEGMPLIALMQYAQAEMDKEKADEAVSCVEKIMRWKLALTDKRNNPFGYPVMESKEEGKILEKFFFPHNTTASPWWQGDNARLASIASAASMLAKMTEDDELAARCEKMAQDPLDWIMGLNPFDSCMIEGYGRNNIQYFFHNRYDFINCPGGIVNGITSGLHDEEGIEFILEPTEEVNDNWRWAEQWIPHVSWFIYAMALKLE